MKTEDIFNFSKGAEGSLAHGDKKNAPVIGISVNIDGDVNGVNRCYIQAVADAGGIPALIPATRNIDILIAAVERVDGILLTGGGDFTGTYFSEETSPETSDVVPLRDYYDFMLLRLVADRQIPVFGVCRGMQLMNIAFGGDIYQDIKTQYPPLNEDHSILTDREKPVHEVSVIKGSLLESLFGSLYASVNSRHHQAIRKLAPGFKAMAFSTDGLIEAIEGYPAKNMFAVQWHPENMAVDGNDEKMKALFSFFIEEAGIFKRAKEFHANHISVDSHCDTPSLLVKHAIDLGRRGNITKVDLPKMYEGHLDAAFMAAYVPQGPLDDESSDKATDYALTMLKAVKEQIARNAAYVSPATGFADIERAKREDRKSFLLGVENGYAIGRDIDNIRMFGDMGVCYITLCHNGDNDICDSAAGDNTHGGLSAFGKKAVKEMNRHGIMIDVSHAAESTFFDVIKYTKKPIVATHSSVRALCGHRRNLTDKQIKALAQNGGVMQICLYTSFLKEAGEASIADAADHIGYVIDLVGVEYVGIGSDFDGGGGITGCREANELINITMELLRRGYSEKDLAMIWGGNLRRVMEA